MSSTDPKAEQTELEDQGGLTEQGEKTEKAELTEQGEKAGQTEQIEQSNQAEKSDQTELTESSEQSEESNWQNDQRPKAPPESAPVRKKPTSKIALLASACMLVLGISIWGLATGSETVDAAQPASVEEQTSSTTATDTKELPEKLGILADNEAASQDENTTDDSSAEGSSTESVVVGVTGDSAGNASASQGYNAAPQVVDITISINCYVAIEAGSATAYAVSDNGAMLYGNMRLNPGATAFDALAASGASLGTQGGAMGTYVFSINGLAQGEAGPQSGWKYYINGSPPGVSSDLYVLANGDNLEWRYVTNA